MSNSTRAALANARIALGVLQAGQAEAARLEERAHHIGLPLSEVERLTIERMDRAVVGQQQVIAELIRTLETPPDARPDLRAELRRRFIVAFARHLKMPEPGRSVVAEKILTETGI